MKIRIVILTICFLSVSAYIASASKTEPTLSRQPLALLPMEIREWQGRDLPLDEEVIRVAGVDDYLNRHYVSAGGGVGLYVGFYQTQRQGRTIHSPLNCLPGAGWNPVSRSHLNVEVASSGSAPKRAIEINRIVIESGMNRQLVLYWYQAHGRVVASEYWGKFYTVLDAMRINRTDGSLIRVIMPITDAGAGAEQKAQNTAVEFVQAVSPLLSRHLPD
jgi:EpsI family protein